MAGTGNVSPVLPSTAAGGVSKAAALFERISTIASDAVGGSQAELEAALARVGAIADAAAGDVSRFAPPPMRQAASDEADQLVSAST